MYFINEGFLFDEGDAFLLAVSWSFAFVVEDVFVVCDDDGDVAVFSGLFEVIAVAVVYHVEHADAEDSYHVVLYVRNLVISLYLKPGYERNSGGMNAGEAGASSHAVKRALS